MQKIAPAAGTGLRGRPGKLRKLCRPYRASSEKSGAFAAGSVESAGGSEGLAEPADFLVRDPELPPGPQTTFRVAPEPVRCRGAPPNFPETPMPGPQTRRIFPKLLCQPDQGSGGRPTAQSGERTEFSGAPSPSLGYHDETTHSPRCRGGRSDIAAIRQTINAFNQPRRGEPGLRV